MEQKQNKGHGAYLHTLLNFNPHSAVRTALIIKVRELKAQGVCGPHCEDKSLSLSHTNTLSHLVCIKIFLQARAR